MFDPCQEVPDMKVRELEGDAACAVLREYFALVILLNNFERPE